MNDLLTSEPETAWEHIAPHLDDALAELKEPDRDALLLRYFGRKPAREIAETLGTSEDAAQKRISRAMDRLRDFFSKRGITVSASGLAVVLSANAVHAAPAGLALTTSAVTALAGTTLATTMNWINARTTAAILASALFAGTGAHLLEQRETNRLRAENQNLIASQKKLISESEALSSATMRDSDELELSQKERNELIRLRGEVALLRQQTIELGKLREENREMRDRFGAARQAQEQVSQTSEEELKFEAHQAKVINTLKQLGLAMILYSHEHDGQYAASFDELAGEIRNVKISEDIELEAFEFVNTGLVKGTMPEIIIFRERVARQAPNGNWQRVYGLADGSVHKLESPNNNFEPFENGADGFVRLEGRD